MLTEKIEKETVEDSGLDLFLV